MKQSISRLGLESPWKRTQDYFRHPFYRWMRLEDFLIDEFVRQARDDKNRKFFSDELERGIEERVRHISSVYWKINLVSFSLLIILAASVFNLKLDINIAGITISQPSSVRELLLFISTNLGLLLTFMSIQRNILRKCIKRLCDSRTPDAFYLSGIVRYDISEFFMAILQIFTRHALLTDKIKTRGGALLFSFVILILPILSIAHMLIISAIWLSIHVMIIINIWDYPSLPIFISHTLVIYVATLDIISMFLGIAMIGLPIRYLNLAIVEETGRRRGYSPTDAILFLQNIMKKNARKR